MKETPQIKVDIAKAMSMLEEKANKYTPEAFAYYVVIGENEHEDGSCETFCEKCIDEAIAKSSLWYKKERAKLQLMIKDLEKYGYVVRKRWNHNYDCRALCVAFGGEKEIEQLKSQIAKDFPEADFSYRRYQIDSSTSCKICDGCGVIFHSCVTADEQETEHWEGLDDDFIIESMSEYTAYELYAILEFIDQAETDIYQRWHTIALKILNHGKH